MNIPISLEHVFEMSMYFFILICIKQGQGSELMTSDEE